jgi:hypothetical protein
MASFTCVVIHCYPQDVCPRVPGAAWRHGVGGNGRQRTQDNDGAMVKSEGVMSEGRYLWEAAVLNAFTSAPETVASKIELAKQAIADRLKDPHAPDACETSSLMYALEALDTLGALGLLIDPTSI